MKVKTVLANFDFLGKIKIFDGEEGEEASFFGYALDCPWVYADMYVDTTKDSEGLFVDIDADSGRPFLGIYVREVK